MAKKRNNNKRKIIIKEKEYEIENDILAFLNRYVLYIALLILGLAVAYYYA